MNVQIKRLKDENNIFVQNQKKAYIVTVKDKKHKNKSKAFWFPLQEEISPEDLKLVQKIGVVPAKLKPVLFISIEKKMKALYMNTKDTKSNRLKNK